jgi:hypothetical protein
VITSSETWIDPNDTEDTKDTKDTKDKEDMEDDDRHDRRIAVLEGLVRQGRRFRLASFDLTEDSRAKLAKAARQDDGNPRPRTASAMTLGAHDPSASVEAGRSWRSWREVVRKACSSIQIEFRLTISVSSVSSVSLVSFVSSVSSVSSVSAAAGGMLRRPRREILGCFQCAGHGGSTAAWPKA